MRKKRNYKRDRQPDLKYSSVLVSRVINYLMEDGKRATAEKILYDALEIVEKQTKQSPLPLLEKALENATPAVEVASKRVGGANYQVPREVRPARKFMLSTRWVIGAARSGKGKPMAQKLAE